MLLTQPLNRPQSRQLTTFITVRTDGRAYRPPDYLAIACRGLTQALRISNRLAKADPHLFGPHASQYFRDTMRQAADEVAIAAALRKVYGPPKSDDPPPGPGVWTRRYYLDPQWPGFRKWFRERYEAQPESSS